MLGEELDSVTNYPFRETIIRFLKDEIGSSYFYKRIMNIRENYPKESFFANMNILGNHDTERIFTCLKEDFNKLRLALCLQMTLPGVPLIYYGDESGLLGGVDQENRGAYPWRKENKGILNLYRFFGNLRKEEVLLRSGEFYIYKDIPEDVIVFKRYLKNKAIIIFINRGVKKRTITLKGECGLYYDKFTMGKIFCKDYLKVSLKGENYKILIN